MITSKPIPDSITVAAKCTPNPGLEYKGFHTIRKELIFRQSFNAGTVETGNFLAIVHAMRLLKRNNIVVQAIYPDSPEAIYWVKEKACKKCPRNGKKREKLATAIKEAEQWLAENERTTEIVKWDEKEWGDVRTVAFNDK